MSRSRAPEAPSIRLEMTGLDEDGAGTGTLAAGAGTTSPGSPAAPSELAGTELHVAGALPGEQIAATLDYVSQHRPIGWATLRAIERASPDRVAPACAAFGSCGGCVLQHLAYPAQLAFKEDQLRRQLADAADSIGAPVIEPAVASPNTLQYRNRSKLVAARAPDGRLVLGAYAPRSHAIVDLEGCRIAERPLEIAAGALRAELERAGIVTYDERTQTGSLRYAVLRANADGQVLVALVTAGDAFPAGAEIARALMEACPDVVGVVHNVNATRGNVIFGDQDRPLAGRATLDERVGDVRVRLSARSFFQANRAVAAAAYATLADAVAVRPGDRVVDAYAGVGGIALTLAARGAREVLGIEEHPDAVADASAAAAAAGLANARFITGDAGDALVGLASSAARAAADADADGDHGADIVVLNPPRKGCSTAALRGAAGLGPRVIAYLSCNPETLVRDLALLASFGYRARRVVPFDMMPHTPHIEALVIIERQPPAAG